MKWMPLVLVAVACRPDFASVDEACKDRVAGQSSAPAEAVAYVRRANCYRRFSGVRRGSVDVRVSEAAENHAEYVTLNPGLDPRFEQPTRPGFTGYDIPDRLEAVGWDLPGVQQRGYWEAVWLTLPDEEPARAGDLPDLWIHDLYFRQIVLQPGWLDAGHGRVEGVDVVEVIYQFPSPENIGRPLVWPVDGAVDVPTTYVHGYPDDVIPYLEEVGYPLSVTVGSSSLDAVQATRNPYSIVLIEADLRGPEGLVEFITVSPETATYPFPFTLALVPTEPLLATTLYRWTMVISWDSGVRKTIDGVFRTGGAGAPVARSVGEPLWVTHAVDADYDAL